MQNDKTYIMILKTAEVTSIIFFVFLQQQNWLINLIVVISLAGNGINFKVKYSVLLEIGTV